MPWNVSAIALTGLPVLDTLALARVSGNPPYSSVAGALPFVCAVVRNVSSIVLVRAASSSSLFAKCHGIALAFRGNRKCKVLAWTHLSSIC